MSWPSPIHQTNPGSSDIVFGLSVDVLEVKRESATPGYANSVRATLEPFPAVRLNEVLANNVTGLRDRAGDRDPWVELRNAGPAAAALDGWYLSDSFTQLDRWSFPPGATLPAGAYQLVWADAEPGESTATEWHTNFRLPATSGVVVLARRQLGQVAVVDYLEYTGLTADQAFGYAEPDAANPVPVILPAPSPGVPNPAHSPLAPVIEELTVNSTGQFTLAWTAIAGRTYRVEAKADLAEATWQPVGQVTAAGSRATLTDPASRDLARRFYRVVLLP
ncbi:MAG: lamin tail domain-containing protein [Verrucomicrobia bacterium]|nr:lamin tail domain-containing protein [Verrucomicrobiota bacterium]